MASRPVGVRRAIGSGPHAAVRPATRSAVQDEVATPETSRVAQQPLEPLEPGPLDPVGRLGLESGVEVERRPHGEARHLQSVGVLEDEDLLAGAAEADEADGRTRLTDGRCHRISSPGVDVPKVEGLVPAISIPGTNVGSRRSR